MFDSANDLGIELRRFDVGDQAKRAGLRRNAAYLIRPDGSVAAPPGNTTDLTGLIGRWGPHSVPIRPTTP